MLHCLWLPEQKWHLTIGFEVNCRKVGNSCLLLPYDAGGSCPQFIRAGLYWNELPLRDKAVCTCSHSSLDYTVAFSISLLWLLYLQWRLYHELYPHPVYSASQHYLQAVGTVMLSLISIIPNFLELNVQILLGEFVLFPPSVSVLFETWSPYKKMRNQRDVCKQTNTHSKVFTLWMWEMHSSFSKALRYGVSCQCATVFSIGTIFEQSWNTGWFSFLFFPIRIPSAKSSCYSFI